MVRRSLFAAAAALAGSAIAAPMTEYLEKRANINLVVLQFALTLEHLENVFYEGAIKSLTEADFEAAGYSADYYNNVMYIGHDENVHVATLEAAITGLGATPVAPCTYKFPYTDVPSFIALSQVLENVGVSAYSGAASLITDSYYLTVAASILSVEALHTSYQRAALGLVPMANPFETPLDPTAVYTLASQFIVSCPASNFDLGFTPFPLLAYDGNAACFEEEPVEGSPSDYIKRWGPPAYSGCAPPAAGASVSFTASGSVPAGSVLTFVNGLNVQSSPTTISGSTLSAAIPSVIAGGQTYVFVTSKSISGDFSDFNDALVLFGGAEFEVAPAPPTIDYSIV